MGDTDSGNHIYPALVLKTINATISRKPSIRHDHPSTWQWWIARAELPTEQVINLPA